MSLSDTFMCNKSPVGYLKIVSNIGRVKHNFDQSTLAPIIDTL
jgi:hypothetical protein